MKNYIFLSPHFPPNWENFCTRLNEYGFRVLGIAEDPYEFLSDKLKYSLTEYYQVGSMHNYDEMVRAVGYFTHKYGKINYIESHNEYWLELEAQLRLDFNVDGYKPAEIPSIKRKSEMKRRFMEFGIPVARGILFEDMDKLQNFINEVGYPVIAKPDVGVGAHATFKITSDQELEEFVRDKPRVEYFIEEFVNGRIISYDGLTNSRGEILFSTSLEYSENVMEIVNADEEIHYWIHKNVDEEIDQMGRTAIRAFAPQARFFHLEFFKTEDGKIIALEANLRPPGGFTVDMWNWGNDMDFYKEYAHMLVSDELTQQPEFPYYVCFSARKHKYHHANSHSDIIAKLDDRLVLHTPMPEAFHRTMGNEAYLYRVKSYEEMWDLISFIGQQVQ